MKSFQRVDIFIVLVVFCFGCKSPSIIERGSVSPKSFNEQFTFATSKSIVLIPCSFEGEVKNYIFDTGSDVTGIQRKDLRGDLVEVRGASNRTVLSGSEIMPEFSIKGVVFENTFATNEDMIGLKEQVQNFGGVLGRSIINKANWLIDYPNRQISLTNKDLNFEELLSIPLNQDNGAAYALISINSQNFKAIVDLGSTSTLNIPDTTDLAKDILAEYDFKPRQRSRYTVGGNDEITEMIGFIPEVIIEGVTFKNVFVNINKSSQIRLGMSFFKDREIYIDNKRKQYRIR